MKHGKASISLRLNLGDKERDSLAFSAESVLCSALDPELGS